MKLITQYTNKREYKNHKINLKYRNLYKYDFNNITNRSNQTYKIKRTKQNYSSFLSKTTNHFDSFFINSNFYSPNQVKTKKLYTEIFSAKTNYTDKRIKSSYSGNICKSRNTTSNRDNNFRLLTSKTNYSDFIFNKEKYNKLLKKRKKQSISYFLETTKLVRKEKIINNFLDDKYKNEKEISEKKMNKIRILDNSNRKNLFLLKLFGFVYDKYLDKLIIIKMKEKQENENLLEKKLKLENDINKINSRLNIIKDQLLKLIFIKEFIFFVINNDVERIKSLNKSNILLLKQDFQNRVNLIYFQILSKYNKTKVEKNTIKAFKRINSLNKSYVKLSSKKIHSNSNKFMKNNKNFNKMKTEANIIINNKKIVEKKPLIIENKIEISNIDNLNEFNQNFNKLENIVLKDLVNLTERKRIIINLKNNLDNIKVIKNDNTQIIFKMKILNFHKNKNKNLNKQLYLIKKNFSDKQMINKILYEKLYNILKYINEFAAIQTKNYLKNIVHNLNMDIKDFYNKMHISKSLYIIKELEKIYLFYNDLIKRYDEDKKFKNLYNNVLNNYKKEKDEINYQITKKQIENEKVKKTNNIMKHFSKIYITSHMKYNMKLYIRSKKNKKKIPPRVKKDDSSEQLLTYF